MHRAGAAERDAASELGSSQTEMVAQHPQQRRFLRRINAQIASVYVEYWHLRISKRGKQGLTYIGDLPLKWHTV
jgi:hypothetical protein